MMGDSADQAVDLEPQRSRSARPPHVWKKMMVSAGNQPTATRLARPAFDSRSEPENENSPDARGVGLSGPIDGPKKKKAHSFE